MERRRRMWMRRTRRIARTMRRRSRDGGGEEMDGGKRGRAGGGGQGGGGDMDGEEGEDTRKGRRRGGIEDEEVRGGGGDKEDEEGQEEEDEQEEEEEEGEETKRRREEETWRMRKGRRSKDDFLDCYGDPDYIGKVGTDIEDSKCSWLVVKALESANEEQTSRIEVGFIAVNDGILLNCHVYRILKKHFGNAPFYAQLVDLFTEVTFQTASGQLLDLITSPEGRVACAMVLAGEKDQERFATANGILVQMGTYFQAQDDFLDCYGDPDYIGKVGTDIEDSKCSWLVVKALESANEEQTSRIEANYGKPERFHVDEVKRVYNELKLKTVFHSFLAKIYQRSK
ncbi:hypothetical protein CBR_g23945 [Chara braunii]|uniref:Farnesyl diphosphate synthase n=1 Tax=Chara braunii TaxID=69332 RepID=A0A388L5B2_CHABU|nr:hypothetical protein CBR_g23945 [Chara braunii]|eukprot:GBG77500.1 hypothetical protein CBR_g23945 [Chara braunii]